MQEHGMIITSDLDLGPAGLVNSALLSIKTLNPKLHKSFNRKNQASVKEIIINHIKLAKLQSFKWSKQKI